MRDWSSERMEVRRWVVAGSEEGIVGLGEVVVMERRGRGGGGGVVDMEGDGGGGGHGWLRHTPSPSPSPGWDLPMILRIMRKGLGPRAGGRGCNHWIGWEGFHCLVVVVTLIGKWE